MLLIYRINTDRSHFSIHWQQGDTWTPQITDTARTWEAVGASGDFSHLMAVPSDGVIYTTSGWVRISLFMVDTSKYGMMSTD